MTQDKPKLTPAEQRQRRENRGITTAAGITEALGMPAEEATKLLTQRQWRESDVERLQAAAARLGSVTGLSG